MNALLSDLRFSFRMLAKSPGFTAAAIAVLALGIGVNTAIFSLVDEMIFSPRPYQDERQIVQVYTQDTKNPKRFRGFSYPTYRDIREQNTVFTDVLAHNLSLVGIGEGDTSRRTLAAIVSANYFNVLGVPLVRGRPFLAEEERPGSAIPVVIVSHLFWQKNGRDPQLVGKTIRVNERPFTVIGIAPPNFSGTMTLAGPELYFPLGVYDLLDDEFDASARHTLEKRDAYRLLLVARLKPGLTSAGAEPELRRLAANLEKAYPVEQKDQTLTTHRLPRLSSSTNIAEENDLTLMGSLLIGMAAIVLLIACLNLANMLLARSTARRKEIAIRLALGGGRGRIVRQLLTEGFVLSLAGGMAGLVLAVWSADLIVGQLAGLMPIAIFFRGASNPTFFAATLAFCTFATLCFALGPALKLSRSDVLADLKEQAGEDAGVRRRRSRFLPRHPLVVLQIALSLGLLTVAGLFVRGALEAGSVDTGFQAQGTIIAEVDASLGGYNKERTLQLYRLLGDRLAALPGIQSAAIGATVPFSFVNINRPVQRAGIKLGPDAKPATTAEGLACTAIWSAVGADYFATVGLPLRRGRPFTRSEAEQTGAPAVAIVDEILARKLWPESDALGQRIQWAERGTPRAAGGGGEGNMGSSSDISRRSDDLPSLEIVGIVPATRWQLFQKEVGGNIYVPFAQGFQSNVFFHVRPGPQARGSETALLAAVRRGIRAAAPGVPLFSVRTFSQHINASAQLWVVRLGAAMFGIFGGLALMLAVVGVYGVKAYSVARRTREIGIRMALGAEPHEVQSLILREGLLMVAYGAGLGLLLAFALGRAASGMLYRVSPVDPAAFVGAALVLTAAALLACWLPARRATKVNPITALRTE
jgi:predicted permease